MDKYLKSPGGNGEPRVFEASTVAEFVEVATWLYVSDKVIFRGQTKAKGWPLVPTIGRNLPRSRFIERERDILEQFKRESVPHVEMPLTTDWQWLALAQHNGLPTRLLDWTTNPLVALWFAVNAEPIDGAPGAVYAFNYKDHGAIFDTSKAGSPFEMSRTFVYFPEHVYPFIQAQAGVFTVHHKEGDSGEFPPFTPMTKIEVPSRDGGFYGLRWHLFRVGISPASLFPGLEGVARKIIYDNQYTEGELSWLNLEGSGEP